MWWSGTSEIARRPSSWLEFKKIVPVSAQETVEEVTTASTASSWCTVRAPGSRVLPESVKQVRVGVSSGSHCRFKPTGTT